MAAVRVTKDTPIQGTLGTTLTRIIPGDDVHVIWVSCASDIYLCYDNAKGDGDTISATARFRIPANVLWPIEVNGARPLIAAVSGTPVATLLGVYE